jgi:hypothetical protein
MASDPVLELIELGHPWAGLDPFIFTVHHVDAYPAGNDLLGPDAALTGRSIGSDFSYLNGWSMYHGDVVPGFPQHPHRGFETVTVVRRGFVDHSDSLGATARYGAGDVQWLTAGGGIQHAEMFPLVDQDGPNPLELFQIWLNLPPASKMVPAHFSMFWGERIPRVEPAPGVTVDVIAGAIGDARALAPPPDSWASRPDADLAIWVIRLEPGASWDLPPASPSAQRMLHCSRGQDLAIGGAAIRQRLGARLQPDASTRLSARGSSGEFLLLQGRPIGAPAYQLGPFVMNTPEELHQAVVDYRATQFGGWPWSTPSPVHDRDAGRFAIHADGRREAPTA